MNGYRGNPTSSSEAVINNAVEALTHIFTGWRATFKNKTTDRDFIAYKNEFLKAMILAGITSQAQIDRGMMRARYEAEQGKEFLPSGAKFAGWCKPDHRDAGIDDFETAFRKIIRGAVQQLHPAFQVILAEFEEVENQSIYGSETIEKLGRVDRLAKYDLSEFKQDKTKKAFTRFYNEVVRRVLSGEPFERPIAIEDHSKKVNLNMKPYKSGQESIASLLSVMKGRASA